MWDHVGAPSGELAVRATPSSRLVLTIGLTPEDRYWLDRIERPERFSYRPIGDPVAGEDPEACRPAAFVETALAELQTLPERPAGIIATDDYPASLLAAAVANRAGLPGPLFDAVLACNHKAWSRLLQREVVGAAVPEFQLIDPGRRYAAIDLALRFPFWLKPVKSSLSYLGFRVGSLEELARVQDRVQAELPSYAGAFDEMLKLAKGPLPREVREAGGRWLIAEELMGGRQCTLEGFVVGGTLRVLGIVDSIRLPKRGSFTRFEYPSAVPDEVQREMVRVAEAVMHHVGFDQGLFNVEFFVDPHAGPKIIEINPRLCPQFTDLYAKVDGTFTHQVLVELATGARPEPPRGQGRYRVAASFVLRVGRDCRVRRVPGPAQLEILSARYPGTVVHALAQPGERLSAHAQDSYSFRYGLVQLGAASRAELRQRFAEIAPRLEFELEPL